jgi:hypothetical protein
VSEPPKTRKYDSANLKDKTHVRDHVSLDLYVSSNILFHRVLFVVCIMIKPL